MADSSDPAPMSAPEATVPVVPGNPFAIALWILGLIFLIVGFFVSLTSAGMTNGHPTSESEVVGAIGSELSTAGVCFVVGALVLSGVRWLLARRKEL